MIVLTAFIYYLATATAAPLSERQSPGTCETTNTRSLRDIIVSCLTIIFACTWVSLHPNIPAPELEDQRLWRKIWNEIYRFLQHGLIIFITALLFPEYIVAWAIRQRLVAGQFVRMINQHTNGKKISMNQAFFVIMGGVHKKTESGSYPLDRYQVADLLGVKIVRGESDQGLALDRIEEEKKEVRISLPSTSELKDKSKSDWLAKVIVLIQTLWFIVQCISRGVKGLPITELEAITLAYAVLNFAIYIAWWDKPNRVNLSIEIDAIPTEEVPKRDMDFFFTIMYFIIGYQDKIHNLNQRREVPNFYNGNPVDSHILLSGLISFLLGSVFGAIHCIDWYFTFSTISEQKIWRISSVVLTAASFIEGMATVLVGIYATGANNWQEYISVVLVVPIFFISPILLLVYLAARVATIYIAVNSLKSLPPDAFATIQWVNFIPHI